MRTKGKVVERPKVVAAPLPAPKPKTRIVRGDRPLPPNYICYPEAFKGRVDKHGNWLGGQLPRCRRCKELLPPKENHVCPGYVPELPYEDYAGHIERMEEQREEHHEAIAEKRKQDRQDRLRTCKRCLATVEPEDEHECERLQCDDCGEWVHRDDAYEHHEVCKGYATL